MCPSDVAYWGGVTIKFQSPSHRFGITTMAIPLPSLPMPRLRRNFTIRDNRVLLTLQIFSSSILWNLRVLILQFYCAFCTLLQPLPVGAAEQNGTTTTSSPNATTREESTFKVLADGTQDLAALVGLFATDSVERYAVDYSRGYLSVAVASCSLLGILGYVRALVKITMGSKSCQDSAFPTGE